MGPGLGTSIRQLAEQIQEATGYPGDLVFNPQRYTGIKEKVLDTTKLQQKYGLRPANDLRPGLARTAA